MRAQSRLGLSVDDREGRRDRGRDHAREPRGVRERAPRGAREVRAARAKYGDLKALGRPGVWCACENLETPPRARAPGCGRVRPLDAGACPSGARDSAAHGLRAAEPGDRAPVQVTCRPLPPQSAGAASATGLADSDQDSDSDSDSHAPCPVFRAGRRTARGTSCPFPGGSFERCATQSARDAAHVENRRRHGDFRRGSAENRRGHVAARRRASRRRVSTSLRRRASTVWRRRTSLRRRASAVRRRTPSPR